MAGHQKVNTNQLPHEDDELSRGWERLLFKAARTIGLLPRGKRYPSRFGGPTFRDFLQPWTRYSSSAETVGEGRVVSKSIH